MDGVGRRVKGMRWPFSVLAKSPLRWRTSSTLVSPMRSRPPALSPRSFSNKDRLPVLLAAALAGSSLLATQAAENGALTPVATVETSVAESLQPPKPVLELKAGDGIAVVGSGFALTLMRDGFFESLFQAAFPDQKLVFRNLAAAGDTVSNGCPDGKSLSENLMNAARSEVVLAFYGAVESRAGSAGLPAFQKELTALVKNLYSVASTGGKPARLVLFGPPARERILELFSTEGEQANANLKLYSEAVAAVALENGVPFVDLYTATERLFATGAQRAALLPKRWGTARSALSVNGGLLTLEASRLLAPVLFEALLNQPAPERDLPFPSQVRESAQSPAPSAPSAVAGTDLPPLKMAPGFHSQLFASEARFPELRNPVQMDWDAQGRLWVLCTTDQTAKLLILEDTEGAGQADRCTIFADDLHGAEAFVLYRDGIVLQKDGELWLLRDPSNSGHVAEQERLLVGPTPVLGVTKPSSLTLDPKGGILVHNNGQGGIRVETGLGATDVPSGAYRFEVSTGRVEALHAAPQTWLSGEAIDSWGTSLFTHPPESNFISSATSALVLSSEHFPNELQGQLLLSTRDKPAGIRIHFLRENGSNRALVKTLQLVSSEDLAFQVRSMTIAPDGALLFTEGSTERGRIYRVTAESRPLLEMPRVAGAPVEALLELLKVHEAGTRQRARNALATHAVGEVLGAVPNWETGLNTTDAAYERHRLEALWLSRWFDSGDAGESRPFLARALSSPEAHVRAEAVRIVRETRESQPDALRWLEPLALDIDPLVRFEVLSAAGCFPAHNEAAIQLVHKVLAQPVESSRQQLAFEILRRLDPDLTRMLLPQDAHALEFVLRHLSNAELAQAPAVAAVWGAQVERSGISESVREAALQALAKEHHTSRVAEMADTVLRLQGRDPKDVALAEALLRGLLKGPVSELRQAEPSLQKLAYAVQPPALRRLAHAAWLTAAPSPQALWQHVDSSPERQLELLAALQLVEDTSVRVDLYPALVRSLEKALASTTKLAAAILEVLPLAGEGFASQNFDLFAAQIIQGHLVPEAALAIAQLPQTAWGGERAGELGSMGPVVAAITRWLDASPEQERSTPSFAAVLQVGRALAARLEEQTAHAERALLSMRAQTVVVRTVSGQSRYDTQRLDVISGQTLELMFENVDVSPQNLVVVAPGTSAEILAAAAKLGAKDRDSEGRAYVPKSEKVVVATRVMASGERQVLKWTAPAEPGEYEFLCTIPNRPPTLRGVVVVRSARAASREIR